MALRVAIDTNRYVDLRKAQAETIALLEQAEMIALPFIVLAELRSGFALGQQEVKNESLLRTFLLKNNVRVLFPDDQTTQHYSNLFRQLRRQATPIPTNDLWIAALVLQHNLVLHSRDSHFDHLPQIARV